MEKKSIMKSPTKTLGILGGMGPAASAEFLRLLTEKAPAKYDQDHHVMYMLSDPHIPDRTTAIIGNGQAPMEWLKKNLFTIAG